MIKSFLRGHEVRFDGKRWLYIDTKENVKNERPCARCGKMPTLEGHDACLKYLPRVKSACCGHGKEVGFIMRGKNEDA
ncbi:hypothetical protein KAR91_31660 [Candidatus Pacearchaeota archaeon]|nr:hypothetical protein [Candidatus Pacearchaeota archaeon]